jgi:hypothetical protein
MKGIIVCDNGVAFKNLAFSILLKEIIREKQVKLLKFFHAI